MKPLHYLFATWSDHRAFLRSSLRNRVVLSRRLLNASGDHLKSNTLYETAGLESERR